MKALITGGAGFIGYHLAKELLEQGYDLVLADNFSRGVEDTFLKDLERCREVTKEVYEQRKLWIRFKEQCSRLLSPLL